MRLLLFHTGPRHPELSCQGAGAVPRSLGWWGWGTLLSVDLVRKARMHACPGPWRGGQAANMAGHSGA